LALSLVVLDAWLQDKDTEGWKLGPNVKVPAVSVLERRGNPGYNSNEAEATYTSRGEAEWPLARTRYAKFHLQPDLTLSETRSTESRTFPLEALGKSEPLQFSVTFDKETEIAGHPLMSLAYSVERREDGTHPKDIDVFVTLRHIDPQGQEVFYTGKARETRTCIACDHGSSADALSYSVLVQVPRAILYHSVKVNPVDRSVSTGRGCPMLLILWVVFS
jgi:hypothetical protein